MRETVDSAKRFVVRMVSTPSSLMQPLMTSSPALTRRGRLSPVNATVLRLDWPSTTTPSSGTFSPGLTRMVEPMATESGLTRCKPSDCTRLA